MPKKYNARTDLTLERVKELLHYDPITGVFMWLQTVGNGRIKVGTRAGSINKNGRRQIKVDNDLVLSARLAHFYMKGAWPEKEIDHKNRIRDDDRWDNLREANSSQNVANTGDRHNCTGYRGVYKSTTGRFYAQIRINRKRTNLGTFDTAEEAFSEFRRMHLLLYGEFSQYQKYI